MKRSKTKDCCVIVSRKNKHLNFGQTADFLGYDEKLDKVTVRPHGDDKTYKIDVMDYVTSAAINDSNFVNWLLTVTK
jgi:hypothetical protein